MRSIIAVLGTAVAVLTLVVAANELEAGRIAEASQSAEATYFNLLSNLGSESAVVRAGAVGQIATLMRRAVPLEGGSKLFEGLFFVLRLHEHPASYPFHDDLALVIRGLIRAPKSNVPDGDIEGEALIDLLCELGPEGWYQAKLRPLGLREVCLAWIWDNAPPQRQFHIPSYRLFRDAKLFGLDYVLRRRELVRADFTGAVLERVSFVDSDLRSSHFVGAKLIDVNFENATLVGADLSSASLCRVDFGGADLKETNFAGVTLEQVSFEGARNLEYAQGMPQRD